VQEAPDLLVDLARGLLAVDLAAQELGAEEVRALTLGVVDRADLLAHPELGDHGAREVGARRMSSEAPAEMSPQNSASATRPPKSIDDLRSQLLALHVVALALGHDHGAPSARPRGTIVTLWGGSVSGRRARDDGVAGLVVGRDAPILLLDLARLLLAPVAHLVASLLEVVIGHRRRAWRARP
jgi:hypothetical protein